MSKATSLPHNIIINTAFASAMVTGGGLTLAPAAAAERYTAFSLNEATRGEMEGGKKYTTNCIRILNLIEAEGELRCFEKHLSNLP